MKGIFNEGKLDLENVSTGTHYLENNKPIHNRLVFTATQNGGVLIEIFMSSDKGGSWTLQSKSKMQPVEG
jgi:hypothetical protein